MTGTEAHVEALVQAGAVRPLLEAMASSAGDVKLQEAAARALKAILQHASVPRDDLFRVCGDVGVAPCYLLL